ncbi:MAG: YkgJ family cysteine cluster protein [Dehalococcoidia bacterium]|nr:YkgJ family cysteine cluster protein [Dehalococcoidia bacterium]
MIKWRCTLCGECCKRYVPLVLPEDVQRIQDTLQRPLSTFVTFYRPTDLDEPLDDSDERLFQTKDGKVAMGLSRVELEGEEREGCVFLKNNLCSIHEFSPLLCRQYPFQPQDADDLDGPLRLVENVCFGKHAEDEVVDEDPYRRSYRLFQQKYDEHVQQIAQWNANPQSRDRSIEDFLSFVGLQWS